MFQVFHAIPPMTSPAGQPTNAVFGFCRDLLWLVEKQSPTWLICAMDSPGPGHREGWYPAYKANRTEMPEDLRPQIPLLREVFEGFGLPIVQEEGWEADDVLATLAARFASQGTHVAIVTNDKDARQLLSPLVQLYNLRKMTWFNEASLLEDWGIRPDQVVDFQGLVGDAVDNVPGVPLVGPKKAAALLQQFETLEGVLANADKAPGAKLKENLKTFADQARLSQKLVRLNTELTFDFDPALGRRITPDVEKLQALFRRLGFRKLVDDAARILGPNSPAPIVASGDAVASAASSTEADDANSLFANLSEDASPPGGSLLKLERTWRTVDTPAGLEKLVEELRTCSEVCIDLETTGLDPLRDEIVGWAIAWPGTGKQPGGACYLPVLGPPGSTLLDAKLVVESLRPILENPTCRLINQNVKFDLLAMRRVGLVPANIGLDTMVGDYLLDAGARSHNLEVLGQKYLRAATIPISDLIGTGKSQKTMDQIPVERVAEYATEDAELVVRMAPLIEAQLKEAGLWKLYDELERPLIPVLADMEFAGITVDVAELGRQSEELTLTLARLMGEIHELAGREFNIDSPLQLRKILFDELKLPVQKKTKTGPSTDQEVLETLAPLHPLPAKITEHRHLTKLKGTYLDSLPLLVNPHSGRIHTSFNQVVAATGRLSSSDPNLQNIPIRTPEGSRIRKAFISKSAEWRLVCADYSQIELRMLAHFSQDPALVAAFANGDDIHRIVAAQVHHVAPEEVTSEMRRIAKAVNFGVMYGQSPYGLSAALGISREEATTFIDEYFTRYAGVTSFMEEVLDECLATGYAKTILGRRRPIEGVRGARERNRNRNMAERTGINTVIQGSAADLIKQAMIRVHDRLRRENHPGRLLLQIHDELVLEAPADLAEELGAIVREEMITALPLDVPLEVDLAIGLNWLDAK
ncbi:MAG: DNA polymerase I [Planctomyces sp.]|nr:DNA polymerase I [Planctomyces sp.]